jgi:hypothetical protein
MHSKQILKLLNFINHHNLQKNNIDELNSALTEILSNNYPTLEILMIVFGSLFAVILFIFIYVKCTSRSNQFNYRNSMV